MKTNKSKNTWRCWAGLAIAAIVFSASQSPAGEKDKKEAIQWLDFEKAVAAAKKERKLLVVDFYTDWCGWCKVMDRDTYGNAEVAKYAKTKLIMSKVNAESKALTRYKESEMTFQQLALGFGVRGYPATIFIGPDGEFITLVSGFVPADKFMPILEFLADGHYKTTKYEDFLAKRKS